MSQALSTVERALELARAGTYTALGDIKRRLSDEGYEQVNLHLSGSLAKQLRAEMKKHSPMEDRSRDTPAD